MIERGAEGINVGAEILRIAFDRFRRDVIRRSPNLGRLGFSTLSDEREAEVHEFRVALGIQRQLGVPVRYVGVGEGLDDLLDYDPEAFLDGLLGGEAEDAA